MCVCVCLCLWLCVVCTCLTLSGSHLGRWPVIIWSHPSRLHLTHRALHLPAHFGCPNQTHPPAAAQDSGCASFLHHSLNRAVWSEPGSEPDPNKTITLIITGSESGSGLHVWSVDFVTVKMNRLNKSFMEAVSCQLRDLTMGLGLILTRGRGFNLYL